MPNYPVGKGFTNKAQSPNHLHPGRAHSLTVRESNALMKAVTMPTEGEWQFYCQEKWDPMSPPACWRSFLMSGLKKDPLAFLWVLVTMHP
jgi:hypothetical protein